MPGRYEFSLPPRRQRDGWFRVGDLDITTTALLVILGVISMFVYAASKASLIRLIFFGPYVRDGELWRLITWPIVNPPTQIWVIITLAFFWFFGHAIEDQVGRKPFAWLIVAMTVIPAAVVTALPFTVNTSEAYGLSLLGTGMLAVFALDTPNMPFFFGIPAWIVALVFVGLDVLSLVADRRTGALVMLLLVIVVALIGARQCGMLEEYFGWMPRFAGGHRRAMTRSAPRPKQRRSRGGGSVVAGPWSEFEDDKAPSFDHVKDQAELDALLDKISSSGMDSLSADDKRRLNELSKRLRGR